MVHHFVLWNFNNNNNNNGSSYLLTLYMQLIEEKKKIQTERCPLQMEYVE